MSFEAGIRAQKQGDAATAEREFRAQLAVEPGHVEAILHLAFVLFSLGRLSEAIALYQQALALQPENLGALNDLANASLAAGLAEQAASAYRAVLQRAVPPLAFRIASNYLLALQYQPGLSDDILLKAAVEIGRQMPSGKVPAPRVRSGPIRLGFVSADFCDHPVGLFLLPLLTHMDRQRFDLRLYAHGGRRDHTSNELRACAEWHDIGALDNAAAHALIRSHELDILVDLSGHTSGNRLPVFAQGAAPVQLSWLGYFATTGVPAMGHVLVDAHHVPPGAEAQFSEQVLRMPHARLCYRPVSFAPPEAPPPCLVHGHITFGSFNNTAKFNNEVLDTWAGILRATPNSRLILKWRTFEDRALRDRLLARFAAAGVDASRIELRTQSFHVDLLRQYADIDIALDPFPFTGGHTSCEALWMGLPIVTWPGTRPVSRQTLCFIANLERSDWLQEWVAGSRADYVAKACALARVPDQLRLIRQSLRGVMRASPLMDAPGFARDFQNTLASLCGVKAVV